MDTSWFLCHPSLSCPSVWTITILLYFLVFHIFCSKTYFKKQKKFGIIGCLKIETKNTKKETKKHVRVWSQSFSKKLVFFRCLVFSSLRRCIYVMCVFCFYTVTFWFSVLVANMLQPVLCQIRFIIDVFTNIVLHDQSGPTKKEKHTQTTHTLTHTHTKKKRKQILQNASKQHKSQQTVKVERFLRRYQMCVCV